MWSYEPPKEDGFYHIQIIDGEETVGELEGGEWWTIGDHSPCPSCAILRFGPRDPSPEELEELSRDAKRWKTCERLAEARGFTSHEWVILFKTGDKSFADAIDGEGV